MHLVGGPDATGHFRAAAEKRQDDGRRHGVRCCSPTETGVSVAPSSGNQEGVDLDRRHAHSVGRHAHRARLDVVEIVGGMVTVSATAAKTVAGRRSTTRPRLRSVVPEPRVRAPLDPQRVGKVLRRGGRASEDPVASVREEPAQRRSWYEHGGRGQLRKAGHRRRHRGVVHDPGCGHRRRGHRGAARDDRRNRHWRRTAVGAAGEQTAGATGQLNACAAG